MSRRKRFDHAGALHHVYNRGVARRPVFTDRADIRYFLSRLARQVRAGRIRVCAWSVMTTHYHVLVESVAGELSRGMGEAVNAYVRYFNRRHRRDGPLFRGRFQSRTVDSNEYLDTLVGYIDLNAVVARLVEVPWEYEWGSARYYLQTHGPIWLSRERIERRLQSLPTEAETMSVAYHRATRRFWEPAARPVFGDDAVIDLIDDAPARLKARFQRKTTVADGTRLGLPAWERTAIVDSIEALPASFDEDSKTRRDSPTWRELALVGLLRDSSRLSWVEISRIVGRKPTTCQSMHARHAATSRRDRTYSRAIASAKLRAMGPPGDGK